MGRLDMLDKFVGRQRTVVECDLVDLPFEGRAIVSRAADGEPTGPSARFDRDVDVDVDFGLGSTVEVDGDASAVADKPDVVPGLWRDLRFARVNSVVGRAGRKEETTRGDPGSTDAEVSAAWFTGSFPAERGEDARDCSRVVRQTIPEPELDAVGIR
jgi:hypothetical protein